MRYENLLVELVRLLAENNGQRAIAAELNERQLYPDDKGATWNQRRISEFMKQHGITPQWKFTPYPEYVKEKSNQH